jgi:phosphoribosylglycinamide formyltransferase-1
MLNIGWFSTGRDEAARQLLQAVLNHIKKGAILGRIVFVFSNRERGESPDSDQFLNLVNHHRIPLVTLSHEKFKDRFQPATEAPAKAWPKWRAEFDRAVMKKLEGFAPDLCVLAGYMRLVGPEMCARYTMLNLHPAVPGGPAGTWQEVIWHLIENRAAKAGAMMHLVTPELDKGPPVTYCSFSIRGKPFAAAWSEVRGRSTLEIRRTEGDSNRLFRLIREHELAREFPLIIMTLKAFADGRVALRDGKVLDEHGRPTGPRDLSQEIEKYLRAS